MRSPTPTILSFCTKEKEKKVIHSVTSSAKITLHQHKSEREKSLWADKEQFPVMVVKGKRGILKRTIHNWLPFVQEIRGIRIHILLAFFCKKIKQQGRVEMWEWGRWHKNRSGNFVCALLPGLDFDPVFIVRKQAINSIKNDERKPMLNTHRNKWT